MIMDSNDFARGICALITKCPNIDNEPSFLDKDNILSIMVSTGTS